VADAWAFLSDGKTRTGPVGSTISYGNDVAADAALTGRLHLFGFLF